MLLLFVQAYPAGAKVKLEFGGLPLHLAVDNKAPPMVINRLLEVYPQGAQEKVGILPSVAIILFFR